MPLDDLRKLMHFKLRSWFQRNKMFYTFEISIVIAAWKKILRRLNATNKSLQEIESNLSIACTLYESCQTLWKIRDAILMRLKLKLNRFVTIKSTRLNLLRVVKENTFHTKESQMKFIIQQRRIFYDIELSQLNIQRNYLHHFIFKFSELDNDIKCDLQDFKEFYFDDRNLWNAKGMGVILRRI
jgi:hypothetical protein